MKRESVVQRMRLCLNDIESDVELFRNVRKVPVSPKGDKELSPGLQPFFNSHYAGDAVNANPVEIIEKDYTRHDAPEEGKYTLESDEDIIVEAHGVDAETDPMNNVTLANIITFTAGFIFFCGYTSEDPWNGRVVWFGCSTGRQSQMIADMISQSVGFPVRVVGTKKTIRVPMGPDGVHYAAEEWDDADPGAPVNCGEILAFFHALIQASFLANIQKVQDVALKIKNDSSKGGYTADTSDMAELKRLIGEFQDLILPPQPAYADFTGKNIPAELQGLTIENNKIKLPPNQVSDLKNQIARGLNAMGSNMVHLNPQKIGEISDIMLKYINTIYRFVNFFGLVAQKKIDFNNPDDVIEAIGVIPAPVQPGHAGDPDQPDAAPQGDGE